MPLAFLSLTAHLSKSLGAETNQPTPPILLLFLAILGIVWARDFGGIPF
jgi:hypothetical protein